MIKWKNPGFFKEVDAEKVHAEIESLGELYQASDIVDKARNPESELHKCFEWDDSEAAEKYRQFQARQIVDNLLIVVEREEKEPTEFRLYQSTGRGKGYAKSTVIARDIDEYKALLDRALAELEAFKRRYEHIAELQNVIEEIENLLG